MNLRRPVAQLALGVGLSVYCVLSVAGCAPGDPTPGASPGVSPAAEPAAAPAADPAQPQARREEGKVGKKDPQLSQAQGDGATLGALPALQGGEVTTVEGLGGLGTRGAGRGGSSGIGSAEGGLTVRGSGKGGGGVGYGSGVGYLATKGQGRVVNLGADSLRGSEAYTSWGVNGEVLTAQDALSTFGIDVDTASYSITRRKLTEGVLPPADAVRVEEFVNAMPYGYRTPALGDGPPFAVYLEGAPSPFTPARHVLRVAVVGAMPQEETRAPVHLTFLVDVSGSMRGPDRIELAQQSLQHLVGQLHPTDTVALVTYAGRTEIVLPPTPASEVATLRRGIERLTVGGGTDMGSGMELAYDLASRGYVHGHENRVIVLSDGDANIGRTSQEEMLRIIRQHAEEGITLSTVGFGMGNYKDALMEQLADRGDGNYTYIDTLREAERAFGRQSLGTLLTIARDMKVQVEFNPEAVRAWRLIGYENRDIADQDFRDDAVDAGEIGAGHTVTALFELDLIDGFAQAELATVRVRARPPGPDRPAQEWSTVMHGSQVRAELPQASATTRLALAAAGLAELLRGSPYAASLRWDSLAVLARGAAAPGVEAHAELLRLIEQAAALSGR